MQQIRAWAVMLKGKPVIDKENHLRPLLIFSKKYEAESAKWASGETVRRVSIKIEEK